MPSPYYNQEDLAKYVAEHPVAPAPEQTPGDTRCTCGHPAENHYRSVLHCGRQLCECKRFAAAARDDRDAGMTDEELVRKACRCGACHGTGITAEGRLILTRLASRAPVASEDTLTTLTREDGEWLAVSPAHPSLSFYAPTREGALDGLCDVLANALNDALASEDTARLDYHEQNRCEVGWYGETAVVYPRTTDGTRPAFEGRGLRAALDAARAQSTPTPERADADE